jgi:hypothetical protein
MLINYQEELEKLNKIRTGETKEGYKLDILEIDEFIRFKKGNFNVILGQANVGKTSMALYLMLLYSLKHDVKWLIFSSENEPYSIIRKLIEYITAQPINKLREDDYQYAVQVVGKYFKFISPEKLYSYKDIIKLGQSYKNAWDYQGFMIDPYNSLIKEGEMSKNIGGHEYDYQAMTELRQFAKRNDISIWLNVHANTGAIRMTHRTEHEYGGYPIPPSAGDVEGGAKFVNRADDFFVFHRYTQHPTDWNQTHIHVRKVKETESGGRPTPMDNPIKLKSIVNNVGFEIDGVNLLQKIIQDREAKTFLRKA